MKRILFLAPYSIPINNPEAICNAKLLRELAKAGYVIDVVSKNNLMAYAPDNELSSFTEKINSIKCFHLSNKVNIQTLWDHFRTLLKTGYVYKGAHWAYYAINYAEKLIEANHYDWIMSRSPSAELAALYLSRKYNIKWIANWNDPYPEKRFPVPYGEGKNAKLSYWEQRLLSAVSEYAYLHTFPCERLRNYMLQYMKGVTNDRTVIIPHICIDDLFVKPERLNEDGLLLVHSGNVSKPRDPRSFLGGIRLFLDKVEGAKLKVYFLGKQDANFSMLIENMKLSSVIKVVKPLDYVSNLKFISQCDVAVLIEAACADGIFLPTKVGDYMQCHKDIFAVSPMIGTLNDLHHEGAVEYFANCGSPEDICEEICKMYSRVAEYKKGTRNSVIYDYYSVDSVINTYKTILG